MSRLQSYSGNDWWSRLLLVRWTFYLSLQIKIDGIKDETKRKNEKLSLLYRWPDDSIHCVCLCQRTFGWFMYWGWFVGTQKISHMPIAREPHTHTFHYVHTMSTVFILRYTVWMCRALLLLLCCHSTTVVVVADFFVVFFNGFINFTWFVQK